jgi:hypothetical protein
MPARRVDAPESMAALYLTRYYHVSQVYKRYTIAAWVFSTSRGYVSDSGQDDGCPGIQPVQSFVPQEARIVLHLQTMLPAPGGPSLALSDRIRSILDTRSLRLAEIVRRSRRLFPQDRRYHIPPNFYHILHNRTFSPSIHQIFALSRISDYRMVDWLVVFGLALDDIPRLQAVLPAQYTTLLDTNVYDQQTWMLSFEETAAGHLPGTLRPLTEWLRLGSPSRYDAVPEAARPQFLYAKIGLLDAFAFPDLLPGSIVRISRLEQPPFRGVQVGREGAFFLVEHAKGLTCSRLYSLPENKVVLCPSNLPFAQVELQLGREARILGVVDFELRPSSYMSPARVPRSLHQFWIPETLQGTTADLSFDKFLGRARRRSGLTFREASAKSALIARILNSSQYFCSPGALSDYESQSAAPRHAHKMISLCALYSISAWQFMTMAGLPLSQTGKDAIPEELSAQDQTVPQLGSDTTGPRGVHGRPALAEFPYFFGRIVAEHLKLSHISVRDMFLIRGGGQHFHPYLADTVVLIVDRRKKRIRTLPHAPLWAQPLYVLVQRDGQFVCTACIHEGKQLVLRPFSDGFDRPLRLKSPAEIEIVGQVAGLLRRTLPPANFRS